MKTIKIFLASSEELKDERNTMADLILHLNKLFRGRGLELDLEKWEYLDASMTGKRKQDEYNEVLKQCDICMVLFWRKFGSFTGEELDTAYNRMKQNEKPHKIYVFFKNPNSDELTQELKDFIANYEQRFGGHFFCKFQNVDTMKLEFLLQLENYQKDLIGEKAIEVRNEHVYVDNEAMVDLNNIPFAAQNEGYKKMQADLAKLRETIEKKRQEIEKKKSALEHTKSELSKLPNVDSFQSIIDMAQKAVDDAENELQQYIDNKNKLEDDFDREQQNLFNTARRITEQRGLIISQRMARAIEAFEAGDAKRADVILDEAEKDADQALADLNMAKQVGLKSLEELILKASVKMANDSIPIDNRTEETQTIYEKAVKLAKEAGYEENKYADLIDKFGDFLFEYGKYDEAIIYRKELLTIRTKLCGEGSIDVAWALNKLGRNYNLLDNKEDSYNNLKEAEKIIAHSNNKDLICESEIYNNLGNILDYLKKYDDAIDYHKKSLAIREKIYGSESPAVARSLNNIGNIMGDMNKHEEALEYHMNALKIKESTLGKFHRSTAISYNNIGTEYDKLKNYYKAIEYRKNAIEIYEKMLGEKHPDTICCYYWTGGVFYHIKDLVSSVEWTSKAAKLGNKDAQCTMGWFYKNGKGVQQNYIKAYEWYLKAAEQGNCKAQYNLGWLYENGYGVSEDYQKAIEWYKKAAEQGYVNAQYNLGVMYRDGEGVEQDYIKAVDLFKMAAEQGFSNALYNLGEMYYCGTGVKQDLSVAVMYLKKAADQSFDLAYNELAWSLHLIGKSEEGLQWAERAVAAFPNSPACIDTLASVLEDLDRNQEALEQFELCLKLLKENKGTEERIKETEEKISVLKELIKANS